MRKTILMMMMLCACIGRISAQEAVVTSDTVVCETCDVYTQSQPTDDRFRVVTNRFWANWFVLGNVGMHAYYGDFSRLGTVEDFISPDINVGFGKWFTPGIGAKIQFGRSNSKGFSKYENYFTYGDMLTNSKGEQYWKTKMDWWDLNVNAMFNLSRLFCGYEGKVSDKLMNQFILSVGIGGVHHMNIDAHRNEWSGHFELQYSRFFDKLKTFSLDVKARAILYQTNFDGIVLKKGENSNWWDGNYGFTVGCTYYIKKRHWDRCLPCERPVYNVTKTIVTPQQECPEYGTLEFFVFFPNNYSGRNDAPTVAGSEVNAIDYLASGIYTQKKFENAEDVDSRMQANRQLKGLETADVATKEISAVAEKAGVTCGYEMSATPISLSMNADSMKMFKEKAEWYYSPIYCGNNTWHYRVDNATATQRLIDEKNYRESQSFALNAHAGLDIIKENLNPDADVELYSFADIYGAIEGTNGNVAMAANAESVEKLNEIFDNGRIIYVMAEGFATSQDNFIGENAEDVGVDRNKKLAFNRAYTVVNWLKGNEKFRRVSNNVFSINALPNPIMETKATSTQGLDAKLKRYVKVRIHYAIDK